MSQNSAKEVEGSGSITFIEAVDSLSGSSKTSLSESTVQDLLDISEGVTREEEILRLLANVLLNHLSSKSADSFIVARVEIIGSSGGR